MTKTSPACYIPRVSFAHTEKYKYIVNPGVCTKNNQMPLAKAKINRLEKTEDIS